MSGTLILLGIVCLLVAGLLVAHQIKRYRIRSVGTRVIAKVIQVRFWNDSLAQEGTSLFPKAVPLIGGWQYEVIAEWTDSLTGNNRIISSGRKKGLPRYQRGDYLSAYISSKGNYLELK